MEKMYQYQVMARRLKEERNKKGLSHVKLGEALHEKYGITISKDSLINYEVSDDAHTKAGSNMAMRVEYLSCLADFYGVSMDYLAGKTDEPSPDVSLQAASAYTGLSGEALEALRFHCLHQSVDKTRYLAFLSSLLIDSSFRHLLLELYRFTTANEGERLYWEMRHQFDEREKRGEIDDHEQYTEEWLSILKRKDIPDEVKGMFLAQVQLDNLDDGIMQDLTKDVQLIQISEVKQLAAMQAFNLLIDEESESPCFKAIQTHIKAASKE